MSIIAKIKSAILKLFGISSATPHLLESPNQSDWKLTPLDDEPKFEKGPEVGEMTELIPEDPDRPFHVAFTMWHQNDDIHKRRILLLEQMFEFLSTIESESASFFRSIPESEGRNCSIILAVKPGRRSRFWVESYPVALPQENHLQLLERLEAIQPPDVIEGPVTIMMAALLWGGIGRDQDQGFSIVPREWTDSGGIIPDEPLAQIWPNDEGPGDDHFVPKGHLSFPPADIPLKTQISIEPELKSKILGAIWEFCGSETNMLITYCPLLNRATVLVERQGFQQLSGVDGINIQRAEKECGWSIKVMTPVALEFRVEYALKTFVSTERINGELANSLVREGFLSLTDLSQIKIEDLMTLGEITRKKAESIIAIAADQAPGEQYLPSF